MKRTLILLLALAAGSGCTIHRLDVQQGNVITDEAIKQLQPGLTHRQVRFIMGTPLIEDPFHPGRWDYIYTVQPGDTRAVQEYRRVAVFFQDDKVVKIEAPDGFGAKP